jgi:hypothetical protein
MQMNFEVFILLKDKLLIKILQIMSVVTFFLCAFTIQNLFASGHAPSGNYTSDEVKGLYISGWNVGEPNVLKHFIDLANGTEINTYVIDIKEDDGLVSYPSQVKQVKKLKNWVKKYDPVYTLNQFHKNNIRVIGRIVCFKDPVLPLKRPDLAIKDKNGQVWKDNTGISWLNPYKKANWRYLLNIAKEAVDLGFDEIQFDYVRFTNYGDMSTVDYGNTKKTKYEAINEFLAFARKQMPHTIISANVFGIICESPEDMEGIGQYLEYIGKDMDYISPMLYPSHYACGQIVNNVEFPIPDLDPYRVVYNALKKTKTRVILIKNYRAKFRPYLQDFTANYLKPGNFQTYGAEQVRQQIKAVYDAGYQGWLFWNINNEYSESAFLPKINVGK